jgi:hypothetical protein
MIKLIENKFIPLLCFILGITICVSTSVMTISYVLIAILVLFKSDFYLLLKKVIKNKLIIGMLLFYSIFVFGTIWSSASPHFIITMLIRIIGYLLAPLFLIAFYNKKSAMLLLKGFVIGAVLSAVLSLISFIFKKQILYGTWDQTWVVFHGHILHNAFLAVVSVFLLWNFFDNNYNKYQKAGFLLAYLICFVDIIFVVNGRTGQIMLIAMDAFLIIYRFRLKGVIMLSIIMLIISPFLWLSPVIQKGIKDYQFDINQYQHGNHWTSFGARKEFHRQSESLIRARPMLGYGTGSFGTVYKELNANRHEPITANPHRDILWVGVETGIVGMIAFIYMLFCCLVTFLRFNTYYRCMGLSLLLGYTLASIENSFFIDNITGMAFIFIILALAGLGQEDKYLP